MSHRSFSFVGGYPLVHVTRLQVPLCASCAEKRAADPLEDDKPEVSAPNWENENLSCEDCDRRIPSAY